MSFYNWNELKRRYGKTGLLIDTNLLLLWTIGSFDSHQVGRFKRLAAYSLDDFNLLFNIINQFNRIITTPGILAEVSNLSGQLPKDIKEKFWQNFKRQLFLFQECYKPANIVAEESSISWLGYVDAGVIAAARVGYLVLTDDMQLHYTLLEESLDSVNLNNLWSYN